MLVAGSMASSSTYATIDTLAFLGFAGYMVATNGVGVRAGQFNALMAGVGLVSALLLLAAPLAGRLVGVGVLALALMFYGAWVVWLSIWSRRRLQAVRGPILQTGPRP